jgi:outer membrane receptor protein involved in Fe transport
LINARQRQYLEKRLPRHVETLSAEYSLARFGIVLRGRHYGQWTEPLNETTDDSGRLIYNQTFGNELFIDVLLSYDFTRALRLTVGVENIFDNYPDKPASPTHPRMPQRASLRRPAASIRASALRVRRRPRVRAPQRNNSNHNQHTAASR